MAKSSTESSHFCILSVMQKSTHLTPHMGFTSAFFKGCKSSQCTIKKVIPAKTLLLQIQAELDLGKLPDSGTVALPPAPQPGGAELQLCCFPGAGSSQARWLGRKHHTYTVTQPSLQPEQLHHPHGKTKLKKRIKTNYIGVSIVRLRVTLSLILHLNRDFHKNLILWR